MVSLIKKAGVSSVLLATLAFAGVADAQTYYYSSPSLYDQAAYNSSCVNISRDLSIGSRGSDVTSLQQFLVSRNYPGGGSWMVTGYYGQATAAAVRNFQSAQGLAVTGSVDGQTRLALDRVSCGGSPFSYPQAVPAAIPSYTTPSYGYPTYPYTTPTNPAPVWSGNTCDGYGYQGYTGYYYGVGTYYYGNCAGYNQYQYATPTITYLSPLSGAVGQSVTVFGTGFSTTGNTIHFGNGVITNLGSPDGRSVSFTVPSQLTGYGSQKVGLGTYYVSVTNASGATSNTQQFTVTSLGAAAAPIITGVNGPTTLTTGTQGQWSLSVNNPANTYVTASVNWGDTQYYPYTQSSSQQNIGYGAQTITFSHSYATAGTYTVQFTVSNGSGQTNTSTMSVVVSGSSSGALSISSITPISGPIGTQIAIQGSGFSTYDNTVRFGSGGTMHVPSYNGSTIYYTIPQYLSPCDVTASGSCALYLQLVTPGTTYPVSVSNQNGTTNTINFTVTQ